MKALILAAGVGRRIAGAQRGPKCLLRFDGQTLLERHLRNLHGLGISDVTLVLGYEAEAIRAELRGLALHPEPGVHINPHYTEGSVVSLWTGREVLGSGEDVLLMDADVLYDPAILARLAGSPLPNCFLLDRDFEPGEEPVKLCVRDGVIVEFRKQLARDLRYDLCGESVGFFRFDAATSRRLASATERYLAEGRRQEPYEECIRDLLLETPSQFGYEDVTGMAWVEIDFPADIVRAEREVLPRLGARA